MPNPPEDQRDKVFMQLMRWGFSMVLIAPIVTWLIFVPQHRSRPVASHQPLTERLAEDLSQALRYH